jgi:hypothetical protein
LSITFRIDPGSNVNDFRFGSLTRVFSESIVRDAGRVRDSIDLHPEKTL